LTRRIADVILIGKGDASSTLIAHLGAMPREPKLPAYVSALPSFLTGVARLFDFWGLFSPQTTGQISDSRALSSDWRAIGHDIHKAARSYAREPR
jgi:hypothetical protein